VISILFEKYIKIIFRYLPFLSFVVGFLGLIFVYEISGITNTLKSLYLFLPFIIIPLFYELLIRYKVNHDFLKINIKIYNLSYIICFLISIILLYFFGRGPFYYLDISLLGTIILFEIFLSKNTSLEKSKYIILFQILSISINLLLGKHFSYPKIFGLDYESHSGYFTTITQTGIINQNYAVYNSYPLYHIIVAILSYFTKISTYDLGVITNVIGYQIIVIIFYIFLKKLTNNLRFSLIFAFFLVSDNIFNYYAFNSMSQSFSFIFFSLIIYILYINREKYAYIFIIFIFALYLTHPMGSLILIISLFIMLIIDIILIKEKNNNCNFLIYTLFLTIILLLSNWLYGDISVYLTVYLSEIFNFGRIAIQNVSLPASLQIWYDTLIQNFDVTITLSFFILSVFLILSKRININPIIKKLFYITLIFYFWFYFPTFVNIGNINEFLFIRRWNLFSTFYVVIVISISIYYMITHFNKNKRILFIIIFTIYLFLTISNTLNADDAPLIKATTLGTPYTLNYEEISSTVFVKKYLNNGNLVTDLQLAYYMTSYDASYDPRIEPLFWTYYGTNVTINDSTIKYFLDRELFINYNYFLFRATKNNDYGLVTMKPFPDIRIDQNVINKLMIKNKIYDSNNIYIFQTK
jgi:hypothetical protein